MTKAKIEAIRKHANSNARKVLGNLGIVGVDYGSRFVGCCPIPHRSGITPNNNTSAFNWLFDRGIWRCFSNNCHQEYGTDIIALVRSVKKCSFVQSINWICEILNLELSKIEEVSIQEMSKINSLIRKTSTLKRHSLIEEETMKYLIPCDYLITRGFSKSTIDEFRAGGSWHKPTTYGYNRLIIPVYDPLEGYLIGFTCRTLVDDKCKWLHCRNFAQQFIESSERLEEDRFYAAHILFNLYKARDNMGEPKTLILSEGPLDVMKLWEAGFKNSVAVLGSSISKWQKELLHRVGVQKLLACFDNDAAGIKASNALIKSCGNYFDVKQIVLPSGSDPGDLDINRLRECVLYYEK